MPGSTLGLAVVEVTPTADATSLASEVLASTDEEATSLDDGDEAEVLVPTGIASPLVPVEAWLFVVLCLCLCP